MDRAEGRLLYMAIETDWGLYEAVPELAAEFPSESAVEVLARAKRAMLELVTRGYVDIFLSTSTVDSPIAASDVPGVVGEDISWQLPKGRQGRKWHEIPYPCFVATAAGEEAFRALSPDERRSYFWENSP